MYTDSKVPTPMVGLIFDCVKDDLRFQLESLKHGTLYNVQHEVYHSMNT